MTSSKIVEEFALNVKVIAGPDGDGKEIAVKWMKKFEQSICSVLVVLLRKTAAMTISIQQIFDDLISNLQMKNEDASDQSDDLYSKKTAIILMRELFTEYMAYNDPNNDSLASKRLPEIKTVCGDIINDLISNTKDDLLLEEIIELCSKRARLFSPKKNCDDKIFMTIWNHLRFTDPRKTELLNACAECILTYIEELKV
ncbi:hypothetical protein RF11_08718 [Thelohanellus kitauei]|uniref:Uncharacterized protein n=1 Tax=Thelohanellus kitauei TaxID=669202 RepID=A0A0C2MQ09_THEKT|nr:hypothetical protein RF11_08718 [Thelohanellus kitauei]